MEMYQPDDLQNFYENYDLESLNFMDSLSHGLQKVGSLGNKVVDSGREILTPIKKTWKEADPDSYNKVKKIWRTPGNAIKDFRQGGGFDKIG